MREILHCDLNNFFASCECLVNEKIRGLPVAVCGSQAERHGIVLAKNYLAKDAGVKTGQTIWQAKNLCPNLVVVLPNFQLYVEFSKKVRNILLDYSNLVEPFSIDESWIDVTNSKMFGSAMDIAEEIRCRVLSETGLTVSIGVSFNKIFAKLGSDLKKPNAITQITDKNFRQVVWPLPVDSLLMIGKKTAKKLNDMGIFTVGQLAQVDREFLILKFGANGQKLFEYSNGIGNDDVKNYYQIEPPKSIGNSTTCYKDLTTNKEVREVISTLSQSIVARMLDGGLTHAKTLKLWIKDNQLGSICRQCKFDKISNFDSITKTAYNLFLQVYNWHLPVRALGITVTDFCNDTMQTNLFENTSSEKKLKLDKTILDIKNKFGNDAILQGNSLFDSRLGASLGGLHSYQNSKDNRD